ncbi:putative N-acetyl-gamma-glutamyl-phosphate chloroplastic-like, partial [Trifolium pratense]
MGCSDGIGLRPGTAVYSFLMSEDLIKQHNVKSHIKCSIKSGITTSQNIVRVGVLGASGYTGSE